MGSVEQKILEILNNNGGEAFQAAIVNESGFSRSRVSEILARLEADGAIQRFSLGKNLKVVLRLRHSVEISRKRLKLGFTMSAEYGYLPRFAKLSKQTLGSNIEFKIYSNGIDVARDLAVERIDLGIAPILTLFESYSLGSPMRVAAPAGSGGSCLVERNRSRDGNANQSSPLVATTKLSTMELLVRSSMKRGIIPETRELKYASSPSEIVRGLASRRVDVASVWEPFATMLLEKNGHEFRRITRYADIGEHVCCGLGVSNHLGERFTRSLTRTFKRAIEEFESDRDAFFSQYAALTGFNQKILSKVSSEYSYPCDLDAKLVARQFERAGVTIPLPSTVNEALREIN